MQAHINFPHPELTYKASGERMELDLYLPSLRLAFEYHGSQHYLDSRPTTTSILLIQQEKDEEKRRTCKKLDITLIEVPYWWDQQKGSLAASIAKERPDLIELLSPFMEKETLPIPDKYPYGENMNTYVAFHKKKPRVKL